MTTTAGAIVATSGSSSGTKTCLFDAVAGSSGGSGGTIEIVASYSNDVTSDGEKGAPWEGGAIGIQTVPIVLRWAARFSTASLPVNETIVGAALRLETVYAYQFDNDTAAIGPYGNAGLDNPQTDDAFTMFERCAVGANAYTTGRTEFRSESVIEIPLGGQIVSHLTAARDASTTFALAVACEDEETQAARWAAVANVVHPSATKPTLIVYTASASGTSKALAMDAYGKALGSSVVAAFDAVGKKSGVSGSSWQLDGGVEDNLWVAQSQLGVDP